MQVRTGVQPRKVQHIVCTNNGGDVAAHRRSHTVPTLTNAEDLTFQRHHSISLYEQMYHRAGPYASAREGKDAAYSTAAQPPAILQLGGLQSLSRIHAHIQTPNAECIDTLMHTPMLCVLHSLGTQCNSIGFPVPSSLLHGTMM